MELIADIFLATGALGAGFYCYVLGRRLNRFNDLENGVGGAVAVLSAQVDDLTRTLTTAQSAAVSSTESLSALVSRAEQTSRKLELQMASLHDVPEPQAPVEAAPAPVPDAPPPGPMFTRHREERGAA